MASSAARLNAQGEDPPQNDSIQHPDYISLHQRRNSVKPLGNDEGQNSVNEVDVEISASAAGNLQFELLSTSKSLSAEHAVDKINDASTGQKTEDAIQLLGSKTRKDKYGNEGPSERHDAKSQNASDAEGFPILAPTHRALWTPPWLRRSSLLAFFSLFTALWIALVVLWRYDVANSGFVIYPKATPFAWTYSPTAVLVVVTGLWRQVDYHAKMNQPWQQMAREPTPAANSLLLDYISPSLPVALLKALRNRHWTVAATTTGFAVLKLVTVISTALLVPVPTQVTGTLPVQINTTFDSSAFWMSRNSIFGKSTTPNAEDIRWNCPDENRPYFINISCSPATLFMKLLQWKMYEPVGIYRGQVFQNTFPLQSPDVLKIDNFSVMIDTFVPKVSCEALNYTVLDYERVKIQLDIPFCGKSIVSLGNCSGSRTCGTNYNICRTHCSESSWEKEGQLESRLLLITSNISQPAMPQDWTLKNFRFTAVSCEVNYYMRKGIYKSGNSWKTLLTPVLNSKTKLTNFTDQWLPEILYSLLVAADGEIEGPPRANDSYGLASAGSDALFRMMGFTLTDPTINYDKFYDGKTMAKSARAMLSYLTAFFAWESFVIAKNTTVAAESEFVQERLRFKQVSLWLTVMGIAVLSLLSLGIVFTFSPAVSQDPSRLGSYATIIARNPSLNTLLAPFGGARTSQISFGLSGLRFTTAADASTFKVLHTEVELTHTSGSKRPARKHRTWTPVPARAFLFTATFMLPVLAIVFTELAYRIGGGSHGFAVQNAVVTSYSTQYISAFVVMIVANLFNTLDFTIITFSTFSVLRSRAAASSRVLTNNPMRSMAPNSLLKAIECGHFGLFSSNLSATIGSALTIIVSNLWIQKTTWSHIRIETALETSWNLKWANSASDDGGATTSLDKTQQHQVRRPDSAFFNDLVFPSFGTISVANNQKSLFDSRTSNQTFDISLEVPCLRPRLFCNIIKNATSDFRSKTSHEDPHWSYMATMDLPPECAVGEPEKNRRASLTTVRYGEARWMGLLFDIDIGGNVRKVCPPCTTNHNTSLMGSLMGCPSVGIIFGKEVPISLACTQVIQQVRTRLKFGTTIRPDGTFELRRSKLTAMPIIIESTATNLTDPVTGLEAFDYRIQNHFDSNITNAMPEDAADPFFRYIMTENSVGMLRNMTANPDLLVTAVDKLYGDFMVQVIDSPIFRRPEQSSRKTIISGIMSTETTRLFMNHTAKIILQTSLLSMVVFGLVAFFLVDLKGTLPRSPHSIASIMALFAGSDLCDNHIPEGAEWMNKQQLDQLFEGFWFSLGWWKRSVEEADSLETDDETRASLIEERFGIDIGTPERRGFGTKRHEDTN